MALGAYSNLQGCSRKSPAPDKKAARKEAVKRRPFTNEELLKVFGSQEFITQRETRPEYVKSVKAAGHSQVFPPLTKIRGGKCSDPVGKWFARLLDMVGLSDPRLVLHSFRHNLVNGLRAAQCPRETIELLDGHRDGSVHEGYAHLDKLPMSLLKEGLERLKYDAVVKALMS